jgi:hypothetical protein
MEMPACAGMTASPEFITNIHHLPIPDQRIHSVSKSDVRCTFPDLRLQEDKNQCELHVIPAKAGT